ncbi:MAG: ABC transporter permease [Chloroflexi bacterium]|nr:ABC transporter permease [Chloroflexota bacterium]
MGNLRAIAIIWYRDVLRFWRDKTRIIGSFGLPILFLFIFGNGLKGSMGGVLGGQGGEGGGQIDFVKFIFPGVVGMTVLMAGMFSGISIVWDREFGFLKEILVAPVSRTSIALGKTLGGATNSMVQGLLMLVFAPLVGITLGVELVIKLLPLLFLAAFAMTSLGVAIAARMKSMEGFQVIMQFVTLPLIFTSGALFPLQGLPGWLDFLVKINPLTYAIDPLRRVVLESQNLPQQVLDLLPQLGLQASLFGQPLSMLQELAIVSAFGGVMISLAVAMFNIQE